MRCVSRKLAICLQSNALRARDHDQTQYCLDLGSGLVTKTRAQHLRLSDCARCHLKVTKFVRATCISIVS